MGKRTQRTRWTGRGNGFFFLCLGVLAVFFLAGVFGGQVSAGKTPDGVNTELSQYLADYCSLDMDEAASGRVFLSALLIYFRYPILAFLLGFAAPAAVFLPLVSAVFGFFLSFSACCFFQAFGNLGLPVALAVFGLRTLVTLPCFLVLAAPALQKAAAGLWGRLTGQGKRLLKQRQNPEWWLGVCIIAAILLAGALAEVFVSPVLLKLVLQNYNL